MRVSAPPRWLRAPQPMRFLSCSSGSERRRVPHKTAPGSLELYTQARAICTAEREQECLRAPKQAADNAAVTVFLSAQAERHAALERECAALRSRLASALPPLPPGAAPPPEQAPFADPEARLALSATLRAASASAPPPQPRGGGAALRLDPSGGDIVAAADRRAMAAEAARAAADASTASAAAALEARDREIARLGGLLLNQGADLERLSLAAALDDQKRTITSLQHQARTAQLPASPACAA